jgi:hypothetical protein
LINLVSITDDRIIPDLSFLYKYPGNVAFVSIIGCPEEKGIFLDKLLNINVFKNIY